MKVAVRIDGRDISVEKGTSLLSAARHAGIDIPALCHHDALEPYGACRLCLVEVSRGGRARLTTSCNYPVLRDGETVSTQSARVRAARRVVMELILARCPDSEPVRDLARGLGVTESRFPSLVPARLSADSPALTRCILGGLCVRACTEAIGASAISFVDRGPNRRVAPPFDVSSEACTGCGACVAVCPTGVIQLEDAPEGVRKLPFLKTEVQLHRCARCGAVIAPEPQWGRVRQRAAGVEDKVELCPGCRMREHAAALATGASASGARP